MWSYEILFLVVNHHNYLVPFNVAQSISSTFYAHIFRTKFRCQKMQSSVLGLKFFGTKILYKKCVHKTLIKLTVGR